MLACVAGAIAALSASVHLVPNAPHALLQRGTLLLMVSRTDAALSDVSAALALWPGWPRGHQRRGYLHATRHEFERAAADFEAAALADPSLRVSYAQVPREPFFPTDAPCPCVAATCSRHAATMSMRDRHA